MTRQKPLVFWGCGFLVCFEGFFWFGWLFFFFCLALFLKFSEPQPEVFPVKFRSRKIACVSETFTSQGSGHTKLKAARILQELHVSCQKHHRTGNGTLKVKVWVANVASTFKGLQFQIEGFIQTSISVKVLLI